MDIKFLSKHNEVEDIWSFDFQKPTGLQFDAGDYVELSLEYPDSEVGGRRWLTIASAPHQDFLRFTTLVTDTPSDFKRALTALKPDDIATISPAIGTFNVPRDHTAKLLWIAGGIGATPYVAMAHDLLHKQQKRDISMLYVAKPGKFLFQPDFRAVTSHYETTTSRPDFQDIQQLFADYRERHIFLSGPQNFCESIYDKFHQNGVKRNRIHLDYFPGYSQF